MSENCIFCKIIKGEIPSDKIWENERFLAFLDINPLQKGHFMIIPKRHVDYFFDMPADEYKEIFEIAKKLQSPLKKATNAKKIGMIVEGIEVAHAHLHLIPLHGPNAIDPRNAKRASPEEQKKTAELIRKTIEESQ